MKVFTTLICVLILAICVACQNEQQRSDVVGGEVLPEGDVSGGDSPRLRVLLIASYYVGHQMALIAVGEELVGRGHNVSLLTTEVKGSRVVPQLVERVGINFISAGPDSKTTEELEAESSTFKEIDLLEAVSIMAQQLQEHYLVMRQGVDLLDSKDWDIVLVDIILTYLRGYISLKWTDVPVVIHIPVSVMFPSTGGEGYAVMDKPYISFLDRLILTALHKPLWRIVIWYVGRTIVNFDPVLFNALKVEGSSLDNLGIANPVICSTTFGLEYPRPLYPSMHFVGPTLPKNIPPIGTELEEWLNGKPEKKVVYISMGTTAFLTKEMGRALFEGITAVGYSAIWKLRKSNQDILEGLELDKDRFFVSEWVSSQLAVLQHQAIGVAVLHGGLYGIQEAIYNNVPVIVIPFGFDHVINANRVHYQKLGIHLESSEVTSDRVSSAIKEIETGNFRERVEKQSKIFQFAGGARKAADILEHYADVGYEHLYPAFYKYEWSWVQYYNADVYLVLGLAVLSLSAVLYKTVKCACRRCCARAQHSKSD